MHMGFTTALKSRVQPKPNIRVSFVCDEHGTRNGIRTAERAAAISDIRINGGDLIDRGHRNLEALNLAQKFAQTGNYIQLWGNHELMFTTAMFSDEYSLVRWEKNGGNQTLDEFRVAPWRRLASWFLGFTPREQSLLQSYAYWMVQNCKLYHIDEHGALYVHAGFKVNEKGRLDLTYEGEKGLKALDYADEHLREAFKTGNMAHPVFYFLQNGEDSFLWNSEWLTTVMNNESARPLLDDLGVNMLVFGHIPAIGIINFDNCIFGLGGRPLKGKSHILVNSANEVLIESIEEHRTIIGQRKSVIGSKTVIQK
ncbi:MAG: metallophosphoesterase [Candidatus Margulisiibacteriota bacterium]